MKNALKKEKPAVKKILADKITAEQVEQYKRALKTAELVDQQIKAFENQIKALLVNETEACEVYDNEGNLLATLGNPTVSRTMSVADAEKTDICYFNFDLLTEAEQKSIMKKKWFNRGTLVDVAKFVNVYKEVDKAGAFKKAIKVTTSVDVIA